MGQRVNPYAALRAKEKDKTMRPTPNLQHSRIGANLLKLLKQATYLLRSDQHIPAGIVSGFEKVARLLSLKLEHTPERTLRPLVLLIWGLLHLLPASGKHISQSSLAR